MAIAYDMRWHMRCFFLSPDWFAAIFTEKKSRIFCYFWWIFRWISIVLIWVTELLIYLFPICVIFLNYFSSVYFHYTKSYPLYHQHLLMTKGRISYRIILTNNLNLYSFLVLRSSITIDNYVQSLPVSNQLNSLPCHRKCNRLSLVL